MGISAGLALIQNNCHATRELIVLLTLLVEHARPRTEANLGAVWDSTIPNPGKVLPPLNGGGSNGQPRAVHQAASCFETWPPPLTRSYLVLQNPWLRVWWEEQRLQTVGKTWWKESKGKSWAARWR